MQKTKKRVPCPVCKVPYVEGTGMAVHVRSRHPEVVQDNGPLTIGPIDVIDMETADTAPWAGSKPAPPNSIEVLNQRIQAIASQIKQHYDEVQRLEAERVQMQHQSEDHARAMQLLENERDVLATAVEKLHPLVQAAGN